MYPGILIREESTDELSHVSVTHTKDGDLTEMTTFASSIFGRRDRALNKTKLGKEVSVALVLKIFGENFAEDRLHSAKQPCLV